MKNRIQAKYNEATELYGRARSILDEFDGKTMPQEKANEVDTLFAQFDERMADAKRLERAAEIDSQSRGLELPQTRLGAGASGEEKQSDDQTLAIKAYNRALRSGPRALSSAEAKALRADSDPSGGFLAAPQQVVNQLIKFIDDAVYIRKLATVYQLDRAESLGVPALDTDLSDADWTTELGTGSEDTVDPFGKRELKPGALAKRIKVSKKLLRQSTIDVETLIQNRMGYKFAVSQEKAFMTGDGASKPLGVFTASTQGISTGRDTTAAGASSLAGDDFINTKHALKQPYWDRPSTRWMVHRNVISAARKLKDGQQNYIWSPGLGPGGGLTGGLPQTLVDVPYVVSEYAPSTIATGQYVAIVGDFKNYWIAEALQFELQVLMELYAETNQVGYIGRMEVDGMPTLEEAFARLKMA